MSIFSYHLVKLPLRVAVRLMLFPVRARDMKGLVYAETMSAMVLGSPVYSMSRFFSRQIVVFAQWENEHELNAFLQENAMGKQISKGWHIRLKFVRQWGAISGFKIPENDSEGADENTPVVAVTIARMRYTQIPRFLRWGRPVEKQVRDNTESKMSLASIRYPNTISTFSIWNTKKAMTAMVHGHSQMPDPKRHHNAMKERERKDFHFEFTTLRFLSLGEYKNGEPC